MLWFAESIQVNKYRIAFYFTRIFHTQMIRICEHGHYFFLNFIWLIGQINTVSERFTHFCLTINTWQTQAGLIGRKYDFRLCQCLTIHTVKFVNDFFTLLDHRHLILASRNSRGTECSDICCLADRITEETYRNAGFKLFLLNLRFYSWISLNSGYCNQIHIIKRQFRQFRNHGLDKNGCFLRIDTACQIIQRYLNNVLTNFLRMLRIISQCLSICYHNINFIIQSGILQTNSFFQWSHIMSDMKAACRAITCQNNFTHFCYSFTYLVLYDTKALSSTEGTFFILLHMVNKHFTNSVCFFFLPVYVIV